MIVRAEPDDIDKRVPSSLGHTKLTIKYREAGTERSVDNELIQQRISRFACWIAVLEFEIAEPGLDRLGLNLTVASLD